MGKFVQLIFVFGVIFPLVGCAKKTSSMIERVSLKDSVTFKKFVHVKKKTLDNDAIIKVLMKRSLLPFKDYPCQCPNDIMSSGRRCGGNSAYSLPKGRRPLCRASDVSAKQIEKYKRQKK